MTTTIEQLKAKVEAAEVYRRAADVTLARALADLAEAQGDEWAARYRRAYADAQESGTTEAHEAFMRIAQEDDARRIRDGKATLDSFSDWQRPGIAAALARITAESEAQP